MTSDDLTPRLRALCDLQMAGVREYSGRHEYDGWVQDLSRAGVTAGLGELAGAARGDAAGRRLRRGRAGGAIRAAQVAFGEIELHRRDPGIHLGNLDLADYDRDYAPAAERDRARAAHLAAWPQAIDAALDALDQVTAPVAAALADAIRGLGAGLPADADEGTRAAALAAHARLVERIEDAARTGNPDAALGSAALTALMSSAEITPVDLGALSARADAERDRLTERLAADCARVDPAARPWRWPANWCAITRTPRASSRRPAAGRSGPSPSPRSGTWSPTPTASAWSASRPSRGAGPWP